MRFIPFLAAASAMALALPAAAQTVTAGVDVDAGVGASTNPFLLATGGTHEGYAQLAITPEVLLVDGQTSAALSGSYRRNEYFRSYGATDSYGGTLRLDSKLSTTFRIHSTGQYLSSINGEGAATTAVVVGPTPPVGTPVSPVDTLPPVIGTDVSVVGLRTRQTSWSVTSGFNWQSSAIDAISADLSASRTSFGNAGLIGSNGIAADASYARALSARLKVGFSVQGQWQRFEGGSRGQVYEPQATLVAQLSSQWSLRAGVGLLILNSQVSGVTDRSVGFSGDIYLCSQGARARLCLRGYRDAGATGFGAISKRVGAGLEYSRRLDASNDIQVGGEYANVSQTTQTPVFIVDSYLTTNASFSHRISPRFSAATTASYRRSFGGQLGSRDDLNVLLSFRARLGQLK